MVGSWAEIVATCAVDCSPSTGVAASSSAALTASTAASMPDLERSGLAPAATFFSPALTSAWASTVAVVVPSPATSLVLVATDFTSCAPRFSYGSIKFDLARDRDAVVGDHRRAEGLVEHDVAALRAERHLDRVRELVDSALQRVAGVLVEDQDLGHSFLSVFSCSGAAPCSGGREPTTPRLRVSAAGACRYGYFSMTARTSRAERTRYSSPAYLTSVPPYLL